MKTDATLALPAILTLELLEILGQPNFTFIQLARLWRDDGVDIPPQSEGEQAFFIHLHLHLFAIYGAGWRAAFSDEITARIASVRAKISDTSTPYQEKL